MNSVTQSNNKSIQITEQTRSVCAMALYNHVVYLRKCLRMAKESKSIGVAFWEKQIEEAATAAGELNVEVTA